MYTNTHTHTHNVSKTLGQIAGVSYTQQNETQVYINIWSHFSK